MNLGGRGHVADGTQAFLLLRHLHGHLMLSDCSILCQLVTDQWHMTIGHLICAPAFRFLMKSNIFSEVIVSGSVDPLFIPLPVLQLDVRVVFHVEFWSPL